MPELVPPDTQLLALQTDAHTGVAYIATGQSPYYLQFRQMLHRLLASSARANDLRVYHAGGLDIGLRAGRCVVGGSAHDVAATEPVKLPPNDETHIYLDTAGQLVATQAGFPTDRTSYLPLAEVTTDATAVIEIIDLRSEALLQSPSPALLGLTATADQINQAIDGVSADVTAAALSTLTAGPTSIANTLHGHSSFAYSADAAASLSLANTSSGAGAGIALQLSLPEHLLHDTTLSVDRDTGFLKQTHGSTTHSLVGSAHLQRQHAGQLTASVTDLVVGVVPINGTVTDVILTTGNNMVSSDSADHVAAQARVNGNALTTTAPTLPASAGAGFRCTDQGDGTSAVVVANGDEAVTRGDLITLDLTRTVNGSITTEAADVVVLVVIRPDRPE